jgi:hypothetical protein
VHHGPELWPIATKLDDYSNVPALPALSPGLGGGDSIRDAPFTSAELEDLVREGRQIHLGCEPQGRLEGRHASLPLRRPHAVGDMPRQAPRESH